jgi:hypothetical protein
MGVHLDVDLGFGGHHRWRGRHSLEGMNMTTINAKDESDVLYALALAMPTPDPKTLDEFVRRHPQHAAALTEFAVELALNAQSIGDSAQDY